MRLLRLVALSLVLLASPVSRGEVRVSTDFEAALQHPVRQRGGSGTPGDPVRLSVTMPEGREGGGFFLFRLDGVAGRTVRVDFDTPRTQQWRTLNPLFAPIDDLLGRHRDTDGVLADPALYHAVSPPRWARRWLDTRSAAGSVLPPTRGVFQRWRYIRDAGVVPGEKVFRIEQAFTADQDSVLVSMRVPYTPKLDDRLLADLRRRWERENAERRRRAPQWEVVEVGRSAEGRPLWLVRIGEVIERDFDQAPFAPPAAIDRAERPVLLFYSREFPDEHDGSWVAQGVIEFLLSDHPKAAEIRARYTVLVVPMLDPDGAAANRYMADVWDGFVDDPNRPVEALVWGEFFRGWVDAGNRLDLVFNLHNVESSEGPHLFIWYHDPQREAMSKVLDARVRAELSGFDSKAVDRAGRFSDRLGGWLLDTFGALTMFYEVNSQAPDRHLLLAELKAMGAGMLVASVDHLGGMYSLPLRLSTEHKRNYRYAVFHRYGYLSRVFSPSETVFSNEASASVMPSTERHFRKDGTRTNWMSPLYKKIDSGELPAIPPWEDRE